MGEKEQQSHSFLSEKAKDLKANDHLPPLTAYNYNSRDSSEKNNIPPLSSIDECPRNDNNRGPLEFFHKYFRMMKPLREKLRHKCDEGGFSGQLRRDEYVNASVVEKRNKVGSKSRDKKSSSHHVSFKDDSMTHKKSSSGFRRSQFTFESQSSMLTRRSYPSSMRSSPIHSKARTGKSCPPSTCPSPNHSGVLTGLHSTSRSSSTLEELQSAVQAAIAHCKNSNSKNCKSIVSEARVTEKF